MQNCLFLRFRPTVNPAERLAVISGMREAESVRDAFYLYSDEKVPELQGLIAVFLQGGVDPEVAAAALTAGAEEFDCVFVPSSAATREEVEDLAPMG